MTINLRTRSGKHLIDELLDLLEETVTFSVSSDGTPIEIVYQDVMEHLEVVSRIWGSYCEEKEFII